MLQLFSALSETLHNQLNLVAKEKHDLTEEAQKLIKTIRQMECSLDDTRPDDEYSDEQDGLKVTYPLHSCIQHLKENHHTISKLHRERYEQVKKLVEALESYASHLEPSFVSVKLPPTSPNAKIPSNFDLSPTYVGKLDNEFTRVYEEYNKRVAMVAQTADAIISLWSELGTPQAQVDSQIVQFAHEAPEQLGLHQDDLKRLSQRRDKLVSEKAQRERKIKELRANVEGLWDRLGVEDAERKQFLASNRGCGLRAINEFEDELLRLNELKRQNLHLFVEDARFKLQELWDSLYFSEEEMLDFAPAFSDVYSDALLSAHEQEIGRLEALKEQRAPILAAVDRHRSLVKEKEELENSSQDASRLLGKGAKGEKRDPGKLLREEKMRKRIAKELPKVEATLRTTLESWEDEYGRPFCVHGERYLDELEARAARPAPPRSKTPNAMPPPREAPKSAPKSQPASRNGTVRGAPPPRSKTPTATIGRSEMASSTMSRSLMAASVSQKSATISPSKIPGATRLPMSTMRDGNNSPERRLNGAKSQADFSKTIRGGQMGQPGHVPPPKMKDLFVPPTPTPTYEKENSLDLQRSGSVVRHVEPEDPYQDSHSHRSYQQHQQQSLQSSSNMGPPPRPTYPRSDASYSTTASSHHSRPLSRSEYPVAPPSRQTSNTSSLMSGSANGSGSENWETYTDNSENEEADASDAYYAKLRAQQMRQAQKRPATAHGVPLGATKRQAVIQEEGSDAGWTDDGDVGEVY